MPSQFYIRFRGRVLGPFDEQKLKSLAARGQFGRTHEVSVDGLEWSRASNYPELFDAPTLGPGAAGYPIEQPAASGAPSDPAAAGGYAEPSAAVAAESVAAVPVVPAAPRRTAEWLYSLNGTQHGPVTLIEMQSLIASGYVGADDLVWTSGMGNWNPVVRVPTLASHLDGGIVGNLPEHLVKPLSDARPWFLLFAILCSVCSVGALGGAIFCLVSAAKLRGEPDAAALAGSGAAGMAAAAVTAVAAYFLFVLTDNVRRYGERRDDETLARLLLTLRKLIYFSGIVVIVLVAVLLVAAVFLLAVS